VDLAKHVIQVHAIDAQGRIVAARSMSRERLTAWCAQLPAGCLVAMESCSAAHHWARRLAEGGRGLANKNARILWAVLSRGDRYDGTTVGERFGACHARAMAGYPVSFKTCSRRYITQVRPAAGKLGNPWLCLSRPRR